MTYATASIIVNSEVAYLRRLPARKIAEAIRVIINSDLSTWQDLLCADMLSKPAE
jgi:hypothetical protein